MGDLVLRIQVKQGYIPGRTWRRDVTDLSSYVVFRLVLWTSEDQAPLLEPAFIEILMLREEEIYYNMLICSVKLRIKHHASCIIHHIFIIIV